ncbi:GNAT family N-acetyltransferase [Streptomyces sp. NBC_00401]|uniref:GNAT family N-acetyltransferase n=1 Tax=unclassified Streptomyces TaxID=2593676 RepID=UPI0022539EEA|nr:GNAT family N-acetyltransferase [Streptomyces sp. NBC_00401]MCX5082559.1 GNAT family N-acetyltransferase [Streptomyces sp. NBC_00401]
MTRDDIDVRPITDDEFADWSRALNTGFLRSTPDSRETLDKRREQARDSRILGAFDGGRCVATFRSFPQELTVPGGAAVPADAISNVTVSATHRRRGLLSRMMASDLADAKARGDVVATLIAAEYPIYGRFGFGPATSLTEWAVDVPRAGLDPRRPVPDDGGRIDLVDGEDVRKTGPELHERLRASRPGVIDRDGFWWRRTTGRLETPEDPWKEPFYAVYRAPNGEVEGLIVYAVDDNWSDTKQPNDTATVRDLIAVTPAAERALWHYVCSVDWIATVRTGHRAPDDLLPHLLPDPRAARVVTHADWLWVRILDVVRALEARTYTGTGSLVLEVGDATGLSGGRYRLDAEPGGAVCAPTSEEPELTLDVSELGTLWLGDESAVRLAALGRVREERAGAAAIADALLRTSRRPWCPDIF